MLLTGIAFIFNDILFPVSNIQFKTLLRKIMFSNPAIELKPNSVKKYENNTIIAGDVEDNYLKDIIIIDTAGKSPYNHSHINELAEWFEPVTKIQPYLVLSATTKKEDMTHIIKSYEPLSAAGLMITKLDETRAYATLCQQIAVSSKPVSCLSTGQKVPEDFMMASKGFLVTLFREGWNAATAEAGAA